MHSVVVQKAQRTAYRILAFEGDGDRTALVTVCNKLRSHLGTLVGTIGFRTLLHRSLVIGRREFGNLQKLSIAEDGTLSGVDKFAGQSTAAQVKEASAALVGQLLVLLETFIGGALTGQLLAEIWPIPKEITERPEPRRP
jgi:hypothetical protein